MIKIIDCINKFGLKLKPNVVVPNDYELTEADILNGTYFPVYKDSDKLTHIISGLRIENGEVYYTYPLVEGIEIDCDEMFPPCGGQREIKVYASFKICTKDVNGNEFLTFDTDISQVNALIYLENNTDNSFRYDKPYLIKETPNYDEKPNECTIKAVFRNSSGKFEAFKKITQATNSISSWRVKTENTLGIRINLSKTRANRAGDIIYVTVERDYEKEEYKTDACGNVYENRTITGLTDDITDKVLITCNGPKDSFNNNIRNKINIFKQPISGKARVFTISARYLGFVATAEIIQEKGEEQTISYELAFVGENASKLNYIHELYTALKTTFEVPVISLKNTMAEGKVLKKERNDNINITSDSNWITAFTEPMEEGVNIVFKVTEDNKDIINDREATIIIENAEQPEAKLYVVVYQPPLRMLSDYYTCEVAGFGEYDNNEITNESIYFELFRYLVYEDNSEVPSEIDYSSVRPKVFYKSSNDSLVKVLTINRNTSNNRYYVELFNMAERSIQNIDVSVRVEFYGNYGRKLVESDEVDFTIKGTDAVNYQYELCFDNHNKFENVSWDASKEAKILSVTSLKHKFVNGFKETSEIVPVVATIKDVHDIDSKYMPFSLRVVGNEKILIHPTSEAKDGDEKIYSIFQVGKEKEALTLKLSYFEKMKVANVNLKVIVYAKNIKEDIWTTENSILLIDEDKIINLAPCWFYPNMIGSTDVSYNGMISLTYGEHTFRTYNIYKVDQSNRTHTETILDERVTVNEDTREIILTIKLND